MTRRTIERDLATLRLAGAPLYGVSGRRGGTGSAAMPQRALVALDHAEITGLLVATTLGGDGPYSVAARSAARQLLAALPPHEREAVSELTERLRLAPTTGRATRRVVSVIEDAVQTQTVVRIDYIDANGTRTTREVEPVGLYHADDGWSLIAWCRLRDAGRLFRLDRIKNAHATRRACPIRDVDDVLGWVPNTGHAPTP